MGSSVVKSKPPAPSPPPPATSYPSQVYIGDYESDYDDGWWSWFWRRRSLAASSYDVDVMIMVRFDLSILWGWMEVCPWSDCAHHPILAHLMLMLLMCERTTDEEVGDHCLHAWSWVDLAQPHMPHVPSLCKCTKDLPMSACVIRRGGLCHTSRHKCILVSHASRHILTH